MRTNASSMLLKFIRPYWWALPTLVTFGIVASLAEGLGIGLIIPALDALLESGPSKPAGPLAVQMQRFAYAVGAKNLLAVLVVLIVLLVALKTMILVLNAFVATAINGRVTRDLRVAICRQLLDVGFAFFSKADQGRLMNTLDTQTVRTSEALAALSVIIGSVCTIVVFSVLLLLLSWQMMLIVLAMVMPVTLAVRWLSNLGHRYGNRLTSDHSALVGRMLELLNGMRTIRLFNQEDAEARRFAANADSVRQSFVRMETLLQTLPAITEFMYVPVFVAVLLYAQSAEIGVSSVLVFLLLLYRLQAPLKRLDGSRVALSTFTSGIGEVDWLLDRSDKPYLPSGHKHVERIEHGIEFSGASFSYNPEDRMAVENVSFFIPKGKVCALVGGSGAGKSTLVNLLCRLYDPCEGAILIDGVDLREIDLGSWRRLLAFAGQDTELMTGSIAFNIAFGKQDASAAEIRRAARLAHAAQFIEALPEGYETQVGTRGLWLSGGQRQRIALARAILREPEVLILDEATNAVDSVTELAIQEAIQELEGKMTIIVIAHRLTAIRSAELVIVMQDGRIVEQGSPQQLVGIDGELARLYRADSIVGDRRGLVE